ncbi:MAG: TolC family protein [Chryseolinea sp.]
MAHLLRKYRTITLSEAIELGYANSKQLAISKAKVQEAQAKLDQAKDRQLPDVSVGGELHAHQYAYDFDG